MFYKKQMEYCDALFNIYLMNKWRRGSEKNLHSIEKVNLLKMKNNDYVVTEIYNSGGIKITELIIQLLKQREEYDGNSFENVAESSQAER